MALPYSENIINRYEIKSPLFRGLGGNGRIFLARKKAPSEETGKEEEVAIKVPLVPGTAFRKEMAVAEELKQLKPPGIVEVYDTALDNGSYYIVMEYLPGYDLLTEVSTAGPLNVKEALETVLDVCNALFFLHRHGISHGDVKPENIVRSRDGKPKLVDFGHSRLLSSSEKSKGEIERDPALRTDVYQVGETLYYLLTGWIPFFARLESLARHQKFVSPCANLPYLWRKPEVAIRLGRVILSCLDLDPETRPAVDEVLKELQWCYSAWMSEERAGKEGRTESFGPWTIAAKPAETVSFFDLVGETARLQRRLISANEKANETTIEAGLFLGTLGRFRESEAAFRRVVKTMGNAPVAWHNLGMVLMKQGALNEASEYFEKALNIQKDFSPTKRAFRSLVSIKNIISSAIEWYRELGTEAPGEPYHVANAYAALGLWDEAIRQYFKELQSQPMNMKARLQLAHAYTAKGLIHEAVEELQTALILSPENVFAHLDLAVNLRRLGNTKDALLHLHTALDMNPFSETALLELGLTHLAAADYANAEQAFRRLLRVNPDSPEGKFYLACFASSGAERFQLLSDIIKESSDFVLSDQRQDKILTAFKLLEQAVVDNPPRRAA